MLAALHSSGGARFAVLANQLGASRDGLRATLAELVGLGLVMRNPGYGHPLRPEYVLAVAGRHLAPACARYQRRIARFSATAVGYRKWTVPLLMVVHRGGNRFTAIQTVLDGITPRALAAALRSLDAVGLVLRSIDSGYPPRAAYALSGSGTRVADAAFDIANRFGARIR